MKKIIILVLISVLLVGCGNGDNTSDAPNTPKQIVANVEAHVDDDGGELNEFVFETKEVAIAMNAEVAPIVEKLGDSKGYFEAESCAFQGMEKTYTFDGFDLYTYEIDGIDSVASISFLDDNVKTKEGVYLYSSLEEILDAYGDDYEENLGLYTYVLGDSKLNFLIDNNEVVAIDYIAVTE